jgi:hypothetical protein
MEVRKFIIIDNEIIMALVEFHYELIPKSKKSIKPIGGGRWEFNPTKYPGKIFFYGRSVDFGSVTEKQLRDAWENSIISPSIEDCEIIFSEKEYLSDVLKENNLIN